MTIKIGDILLLTSRTSKKNYFRYLLTKIIEKLNGKFVHSAIVYLDGSEYMVAEMEWEGVRRTKLSAYIKEYSDRIWVMQPTFVLNINKRIELSKIIKNARNKYDYFNLVIWQLIKALTGRFLGRNTVYRQGCSEFVARKYNKVFKGLFPYEKSITPNEIGNNKMFNLSKFNVR